MKYILKIIFYLSLAKALSGCGNHLHSTEEDQGVVPQPNILRNFDPKLISTLQNEQKRSVKLNDLIQNIENSSFYINDHIVFSSDKESKTENKSVKLHVQTQCIESKTHKTFTKNTIMDYTNEIMLISLIPEQLFSYGNFWWLNEENRNPTCSFHFEAKNNSGRIHYFELPHLPILSFDNSLNLSLIEQRPPSNEIERVAHFPILKFNRIEDYAVISGKNTTVNTLHLICEKFDLSFDVDDLRHYDLWKLQGWSSINKENRVNQPCRFVSSNDDFIVGVSQLFPIVFPIPTQKMTIQLITDAQEINTLKDKYPLSVKGYDFNGIQQMQSDFEKKENLSAYHNLAVLKIKNKTIDTIHLYIPETTFQTDIHFFYSKFAHKILVGQQMHVIRDVGSFITMTDAAQFILTPSLIKAKKQSMEINDEGHRIVYNDNHALLTLTAGATALIPLSVNIQKQCDFKKHWLAGHTVFRSFRNVGVVFEGSIFPIHQVLDVTDMDSAKKTIIDFIKPYQDPSNAFRLDVGLKTERKINKYYFYKNTCSASKALKFDTASIAHQGAWEMTTTKNNELQFTKDPTHSLSQAENMFTQIKQKEQASKRMREAEQRRSAERNRQQNQHRPSNTSYRRDIPYGGDGPRR